jgi:hypothetical protein
MKAAEDGSGNRTHMRSRALPRQSGAAFGVAAGIIFLAVGLLAPATVAERLTDSRAPLSRPAPSPDGRWVAYVVSTESGDAVAVTALPPEGAIQHAMVTGPIGDVAADLIWTGDPFPLLWVTKGGALWLMESDGALVSHSLGAPRSIRGYAWDPLRAMLVVHGRSVAVEHSVPPTPDSSILSLGGVSSEISSLAIEPETGSLLYADRGAVVAQNGSGSARTVLSPDLEIAEFRSAQFADQGTVIMAVARRRGARVASTVVRLDVATGERTMVEADGREVEAVTPLGCAMAVVEADKRLWLADFDSGTWSPLSPAGVLESDAALTADSAWLIVASSGREDMDLDGRVTTADPANLYWIPIVDGTSVLPIATP